MIQALFDRGPQYEAHAIDVVHPMIARAWQVLGGREEYRVELTVRGEWTCTCKDYTFHGRKERPMGCKHTRFVADLGKEPAAV